MKNQDLEPNIGEPKKKLHKSQKLKQENQPISRLENKTTQQHHFNYHRNKKMAKDFLQFDISITYIN